MLCFASSSSRPAPPFAGALAPAVGAFQVAVRDQLPKEARGHRLAVSVEQHALEPAVVLQAQFSAERRSGAIRAPRRTRRRRDIPSQPFAPGDVLTFQNNLVDVKMAGPQGLGGLRGPRELRGPRLKLRGPRSEDSEDAFVLLAVAARPRRAAPNFYILATGQPEAILSSSVPASAPDSCVLCACHCRMLRPWATSTV